MPDIRHQTDTENTIRALAARYKVAYAQTAADTLGHHITRLSGDTVALDEPALLLLALERAVSSAKFVSRDVHLKPQGIVA